MAASGDELRRAMRRFPSGVCVVTVDDEGTALGTTVGSLVSLSLEPALVGISIGHQSSIHLPLRHAGRFAVSVLGGDQAHVAQHFARSMPPFAQWVGIDRREDEGPETLVDDALAWLAPCVVVSEHEAGDHTVFVGAVERVELGRPREALVYLQGGYRSA
jgi:flavin reductase (DIM6/NTAB) family NADH-FMN oxidoreductase RutF